MIQADRPLTDLLQSSGTRIWTDLDLDAEGRQLGYLRLNISTDERGASWVPIPVASFKNGPGPRLLILGGVHGDEFEGQIMLMKLIRTLAIENVRGHIIVMPAANAPAAYAGRRTSPLDGGNLNRAYPGDPKGGPTAEIAHLINAVFLPYANVLLDFHSGGAANRHVPSAHVYHHDDPAVFATLLEMLRVFAMPLSVVLKGLIDHDKKAIGACERLGVLRFASELGGGGGVTRTALLQAETGLARLLFHLEAIREPMTDAPAEPTELVERLPNKRYVYAMASGHFEPIVDLGQTVRAGDAAGAIHFPHEPWRPAEIAHFAEAGKVLCLRTKAPTELGDCLAILCRPFTP